MSVESITGAAPSGLDDMELEWHIPRLGKVCQLQPDLLRGNIQMRWNRRPSGGHGDSEQWWPFGPSRKRVDEGRPLHAVVYAEVEHMDLPPPLHHLEDGAISCRESEAVPWSEVNVANELGCGHRPGPGEPGRGGRDGGWAELGGAGDERPKEPGGEPLVGVAMRGGDVVQNPHDLLNQGGVVGLDSGGAVEEELLDACTIQASEAPLESAGE